MFREAPIINQNPMAVHDAATLPTLARAFAAGGNSEKIGPVPVQILYSLRVPTTRSNSGMIKSNHTA
jgi:hypothetical protein